MKSIVHEKGTRTETSGSAEEKKETSISSAAASESEVESNHLDHGHKLWVSDMYDDALEKSSGKDFLKEGKRPRIR